MCCHRLVVGDAVEVVALDDVVQLVGHPYFALFYNFVVAYGVKYYIGCHNSNLAHLLVAEESVGNLYKTFSAQFLALEVVSYGHIIAH